MNRLTLIHNIYRPIEQQIAHVRLLNRIRGWGLYDKDFADAEKWAPEWPTKPSKVVTLVPYLPDHRDGRLGVERTFDELWRAAAAEQSSSSNRLKCADPAHLRLFQNARHRPGLHWEVIDFDFDPHCTNRSPGKFKYRELSPHAGILATAALHPEWVRSMAHSLTTPSVWLSGYVVRPANEQYFSWSLCLDYDGERKSIGLRVRRADDYDLYTMQPIRVVC